MRDSPNLKHLGAYYTPPEVVRSLVRWATQSQTTGSILDPSCGDGRFLAGLPNGVGVDIDPAAVAAARSGPGEPRIVNSDFFSWAAETELRFDAAIGNPPFIRYQRFNGETRRRALDLSRKNGVRLTALSSSWAPFVVCAASLLNRGGRIAFVVPGEIGHAVYARPVVEWLMDSFSRVEVIAVRSKLFPDLSEDCWLLRAVGWGGSTQEIHMARLDSFTTDESGWEFERIARPELVDWNLRLRPFLLSPDIRETYRALGRRQSVSRLGALARVGIGYVTGANDFFHLRPSEAEHLGIPPRFLRTAVRSNRDLAGLSDVTAEVVEEWLGEDRAMLLLDLTGVEEPPEAVRAYLDSQAGREARKAYKCRVRDPWYVVPHIQVPGAFLTIMSGQGPRLVGNSAGAVCTNSVHAVRFKNGADVSELVAGWGAALTQLSCEIEGHALGGGLLKIEPGEAKEVLVGSRVRVSKSQRLLLQSGIRQLKGWRNVQDS